MRKTKIICTIGPASSNEKTLTQMIQAGMNVARLNFSHGSYPEHLEKIQLIKKVRDELRTISVHKANYEELRDLEEREKRKEKEHDRE